MRELWSRLEAYFAEHWPSKALRLRDAATQQEIESAEAELGIRFPGDFRESLAIHDGQDEDPDIVWLPGIAQLGSLSSMLACWNDDRRYFDPNEPAPLGPSECVKQVYQAPYHITFAGSACWDYDRLLFDFEPGPKGASAQIIVWADESDDIVVLTRTWRRLMEITVDGLESGTITMRERDGLMTPVYRSPQAKKRCSMLKYFSRATREG